MKNMLRNIFMTYAVLGGSLAYAQHGDLYAEKQKSLFYKQMDSLNALPSSYWPVFLREVPEWNEQEWALRIEENCYDFALNIKPHKFLVPGELDAWRRGEIPYKRVDRSVPIDAYVEANKEGLLKDGLRPLKTSFLECQAGEMPVALFFKEGEKNDLHFMALRLTMQDSLDFYEPLVWISKWGAGRAHMCESDNRPGKQDDIFAEADSRAYFFAGFYAAPVQVVIPNTSPFTGKVLER